MLPPWVLDKSLLTKIQIRRLTTSENFAVLKVKLDSSRLNKISFYVEVDRKNSCAFHVSSALNIRFIERIRIPFCHHYNDVIMRAMASQIISLTIVYSAVYLGADQRKHQNSASLAFARGIHRSPMNSPHKWPVTRKMHPFDDVIMTICVDTFLTPQVINSLWWVTPYDVGELGHHWFR